MQVPLESVAPAGRTHTSVPSPLWLVAIDGVTCDGAASIRAEKCIILEGDDIHDVLAEYTEEQHVDWDYCRTTTFWVRPYGEPDEPWREIRVEAEQTVVFHGYDVKR